MNRRLASLRSFALVAVLTLSAAACAPGTAQWTFAPTPPATPAQATGGPSASPTGSPAASATIGPTGSPTGATTGCSADATVIKIEETASLTMVPNSITVTKGEKVCFQVTNTAGFTHNFYVGPAADIEARNKTAQVAGTPDFPSGTETLEYTFSGSGPYEYACWVVGHLEAGMKGTVSVQ